MPLPIAHALMGASVALAFRPHSSLKRDWKFLLLGAFLGVMPDFDYALTWARVGGRGWHHDFTHSILFALLAGLVTAAVINHFSSRIAQGLFVPSASQFGKPRYDNCLQKPWRGQLLCGTRRSSPTPPAP